MPTLRPHSAVLNTNITFTKVIQDGEAVWGPGPRSLGRLVEKLEGAGLVRTLAEPNLTAVSGETAKFLAGGEFPVPMAAHDGQIAMSWKTFGVNVAFKPVVLSEGRISLTIAAEVSQLSNDGAVVLRDLAIPALKVRRAETTVELPSGGALMIAGLLQDQTKQTIDSLPGLMNLPILGALYRSRDYQNGETELVVIVTPYLVKDTAPGELQTPADGLELASDAQTVLLGRLNKVYRTPPQAVAGRAYQGPYGYVID